MSLAAKQKGVGGAGLKLGGIGTLSSMLKAPAAVAANAGVLGTMSLARIHEDPRNGRRADNPGYSQESLEELAETIRESGGLKSPVSLRPHPDIPGDFIINHGHRRCRASRIAGFTEVPYFIDEKFDDDDQFIENIQREGHTAREIADKIGQKLSAGWSYAQMSKRWGKSKAWISQHAQLLDLPEPVATAFFSGQVNDVTTVNELVRAHKEDPDAVTQLLAAGTPVTRDEVKQVRAKRNSSAGTPFKKREPAKQAKEAKTGDVRRMEEALADRLGTGVEIRAGKKDSAQLVIHSSGWEHFNDLLTRLGLGDVLEAKDEA